MDDLVNKIHEIGRQVEDANIHFNIGDEKLLVRTPSGDTWFDIIRLYRPSSVSIREAADLLTTAKRSVLVLTAATKKAIEAAAPYNHITLPEGSLRLMAPGLALIRESQTQTAAPEKKTKLKGRSGVVAETLLQFPGMPWSIHELANRSRVSPTLAHRVLTRLEDARLVTSKGFGPEKTRILSDPAALAEIWSEEDKPLAPILQGYIYGSSPEIIVKKFQHAFQSHPLAAGGILAANSYEPILTKVPYPIRIWIPGDFILGWLDEVGFEKTTEGHNIELCQAPYDPWLTYAQSTNFPRVSAWRAWMEIAQSTGARTQELAEKLLANLTRQRRL
ncbi:MAG: hypothetical protein EOP06_07845 [Proteobacteria bacterium]|nr:MAG: hypothetical protein EOP06_07845 [Pseudomonadota bacterium]